jgi:hypothetical protein
MAAIDFPNTPSLNQEFTVGSKTWIWDGTSWNAKQNGLYQYNYPPSKALSYYNEMFYIPGTNNDTLTTANSGSSAAITAIAAPDANSFGVLQLNSGTTASTGRNAIFTSQMSLLYLSNSGTTTYESRIMQTALSSSSLRFVSIIGFLNVNGALATQTTGIFFVYDEGGIFTGTGSPNWQVCVQNGTSSTFVTTSTAVVANAWKRLNIQVSSTATPPTSTSVNFYIDDSLVATPAVTNFPTTKLGFGLGVYNGVGTGLRTTLLTDYLKVNQQFITGR